MYFVRGTELGDFLRCRLKWNYIWIKGLKPKKPNNKLAFGILFHKFLEVYYKTGDFNEASEATKEILEQETARLDEVEFLELNNLLWEVIANYWVEYSSDFENWETVATELNFQIPLDDEIGYSGTIDLVVRDKSDGKLWLIDHKTTSNLDSYDKNSDLDRQISRYWWAAQRLLPNEEIGGFLYNLVAKEYPVEPKMLKSGKLSVDKSQKTNYQLYMQAIEANGLNPADYTDHLEWLKENGREFFRRVRVTRTQSEIDASIEELYSTAIDMDALKDETKFEYKYSPFYRNITRDCHWCPFQPICQASMDGSNVDYLVESLYTKGE